VATSCVAPRAGAWVETASLFGLVGSGFESHPVRVRGLKHRVSSLASGIAQVAPRAGAWVETSIGNSRRKYATVAPRAGAWVETYTPGSTSTSCTSHPVRVRGLKLEGRGKLLRAHVAPRAGAWVETITRSGSWTWLRKVAPRAGAWVETPLDHSFCPVLCRRTPCGCVG